MQIWAESGKSALPICNYSQILYQFLAFTQNLKRSHSFITLCVYTINCSKEQNNFLFHNFFLRAATSQTCSPILLFEINFTI